MDIIILVIFRTSPAYDYYFRKVLGLVYYDGSSRTFDVSFFIILRGKTANQCILRDLKE